MEENEDRLFIGLYPAGVVYADKKRERNGDYMNLAFISYERLELEPREGWDSAPFYIRERINEDAARLVALKGQFYQIAGNSKVILGGDAAIPKPEGYIEGVGIVVPQCPFCGKEERHKGHGGFDWDPRELEVYRRIERISNCGRGEYYIQLPKEDKAAA